MERRRESHTEKYIVVISRSLYNLTEPEIWR